MRASTFVAAPAPAAKVTSAATAAMRRRLIAEFIGMLRERDGEC
jgi:hypothetical protein